MPKNYDVRVTVADDGTASASMIGAVTPPPPPPPDPGPTAPEAPTGLSGMYMPDGAGTVMLSWIASPAGVTYDVYGSNDRQADTWPRVAQGVHGTAATWDVPETDKDATWTFTAVAIDKDGNESIASDVVDVLVPGKAAPPPPPPPPPTPTPAGMMMPAPVNPRATAAWVNGKSVTTGKWDPYPGASSYRVRGYGNLIVEVPGTSFALSGGEGSSYDVWTVSAVVGGMETLPSVPCLMVSQQDPSKPPAWGGRAPVAIKNVVAVGQWNQGLPRIRVEWDPVGFAGDMYVVYRDGLEVARGLWCLYYYDWNVTAGASHSYQVAHISVLGTTWTEGPKSAPVTGSAANKVPTAGGTLKIASVVPNDDSVQVTVVPFPGAVDYAAWPTNNPNKIKYAGDGGLTIEVNGLDPAAPDTITVAACDKLGPFMRMDGAMPMGMAATSVVHVNGQGDPSNVPYYVAMSAAVSWTPKPRTLTGKAAFMDHFRGSQPFVAKTPVDQAVYAHQMQGLGNPSQPYSPAWGLLAEFENNNWLVRYYLCNRRDSVVFLMGNHMMDTLYDGGISGPRAFADSTPPHNNNASIAFFAKQTVRIAGSDVLHVTMEVDGHFNPRRWCDMILTPAGDPVVDVAVQKLDLTKRQSLTVSGTALVFQITADLIQFDQFVGTGNATSDHYGLVDNSYPGDHWGPGDRGTGGKTHSNQGVEKLDRRSRYDWYVSKTEVAAFENGVLLLRKPLHQPLGDADWVVGFTHHVYHTDNDRNEVIQYQGRDGRYWANFRPFDDERHWDNMGYELVPAIPNVPT